jgi:ribonuclease HII
MYQWNKNKGYPTKAHREAIRLHGATDYHRTSFNLLGTSPQLEFDF